MKYILKNNEWLPAPDEKDEEEIAECLTKIKRQPKYIRKQFELAWNDIFMLRMIREVRSEDDFKHLILPDLIIPKA